MQTDTYLSPGERSDLELCGITSTNQLARISAEQLWADLQKAQHFFPQHRLSLTPQRLAQICGGQQQAEQPAAEPQQQNEPTAWDELQPLQAPQIRAAFKHRTSSRTDSHDGTVEVLDKERGIPVKKAEKVNGLSKHFHAVHCTHSWRTYFGALATLLVFPALVGLVAVPVMLLSEQAPQLSPLMYGAGFAALVIPYLIYVHTVTCSVCHMNIFSFKAYTRNRAAHHLPLLGYTFATALHILIFFQYRCPACGTQQKLFGRRHGRPHHH